MYSPKRPSPMGRAALILLKLTSVGLILAVLGLLLPSFLLFFPNPPDINLPLSGQGFSQRFDAATNTLHILGNLSATIEGVYDVQEASLQIVIRNLTMYEIVNQTQGPYTLIPGRQTDIPIDIPIDIASWMANGGDPLMRPDQFAVRFALRALYTAGYVGVAGAFQVVMPWDPPLSRLHLDTGNATSALSGSNVTWSLPYEIETASYLQGLAIVELTLTNATDQVAYNSTTIQLGTSTAGNFTLTMSAADAIANDGRTLTLTIRITLPGGLSTTTTRQIPWSRP